MFCQLVAGRHLEALLGQLTPEQCVAMQALGEPADLSLVAQMRVKLEAMD